MTATLYEPGIFAVFANFVHSIFIIHLNKLLAAEVEQPNQPFQILSVCRQCSEAL